uniref:Uncharacterized protein n=1 Tax=Opuntia streptacantha TaxID=393608 RepID=A0A7C9EGG1_OPUST
MKRSPIFQIIKISTCFQDTHQINPIRLHIHPHHFNENSQSLLRLFILCISRYNGSPRNNCSITQTIKNPLSTINSTTFSIKRNECILHKYIIFKPQSTYMPMYCPTQLKQPYTTTALKHFNKSKAIRLHSCCQHSHVHTSHVR